MPPSRLTLTPHSATEAALLMNELCEVYADAYGAVPGEDTHEKSGAFRERATGALGATRYSLETAQVDGQLVGFAFGYSLRRERGWWDGLSPEPPEGFTEETGDRTVVLAEIEVRRAWQGRGIGRAVHDAFLSGRSEQRATLASNPHAKEIHALYERWGWQKMGIVPGKPGSYYPEYVRFVLSLSLAGR